MRRVRSAREAIRGVEADTERQQQRGQLDSRVLDSILDGIHTRREHDVEEIRPTVVLVQAHGDGQ